MAYPVDFIANPETRCPVALLLDSSASMKGAAIAELEIGLARFFADIRADDLARLRVEPAVIRFGGGASLLRDFATVAPREDIALAAQGNTPLGAALHLGLDALDFRLAQYRAAGISHHRPWMIVISDGAPTDGVAWQLAARRVQEAELAGRVALQPIGVKRADMALLDSLSAPFRPALRLKGLNFSDLFAWLSRSLRQVSRSRDIPGPTLPPPGAWAEARM